MPRLYVLMFHIPMSSPMMTRILGFGCAIAGVTKTPIMTAINTNSGLRMRFIFPLLIGCSGSGPHSRCTALLNAGKQDTVLLPPSKRILHLHCSGVEGGARVSRHFAAPPPCTSMAYAGGWAD